MNGMPCPRCGKPVNPSVAQCPHCGQPLRAAAPAAVTTANATLATGALQNAYEAQKRRNLIIGSVLGGLALLFALIMGLKAAGILGASANRPDAKTLSAKGTVPGVVLQAKGNNGPQVTQATAERPKDLRMPQDVYDWLKHLEKCEAFKNEITGDQFVELQLFKTKLEALGAGIGLMDPYDQSSDSQGDDAPGSYTAGKVKDLRPRWQELVTFFHSKQPPAECQPLADSFSSGLNEIMGQAGDIADLLNAADVNPTAMLEKATKLRNKSGDIDRFLIKCDRGLTAICSKYNVAKWFNINPDPMGSTLTAKPGMLAPPTTLSPGGSP